MTTNRRYALAIPIVLASWLAVLATVMRLSGAAPAALVIMPPDGLIAALPQGASVTSIGPYSITIKGGVGLVAALYAAGAPLVLPAGLTSCLPQAAI
jgi:hypothetical protein